ncbi:hypothetical protein [Streptomyces sp. NPDC002490]|uniref:hypothetical protein n=1 Tax=Streptomyces sp. NPDC002490 TaxID=3154416 RepID=UPI00332EC4B1
MTVEPADSPATLYGPASAFLGVIGVVSAVFAGYIGAAIPVLAGVLAVTFGLLGLGRGLSRPACLVGTVTGALSVLYPLFLMSLVTA